MKVEEKVDLEAQEQNNSVAYIKWSVADFESRAESLYETHSDSLEDLGIENWREFFDEAMFPRALKTMIEEHDANVGVTWDTVDLYLKKFCLKSKPVEDTFDFESHAKEFYSNFATDFIKIRNPYPPFSSPPKYLIGGTFKTSYSACVELPKSEDDETTS